MMNIVIKVPITTVTHQDRTPRLKKPFLYFFAKVTLGAASLEKLPHISTIALVLLHIGEYYDSNLVSIQGLIYLRDSRSNDVS